MINKTNDFHIDTHWQFTNGKRYAFAFISLFLLLVIIYGNSFQGQWIFDDNHNIVENGNIHINTLSWENIKKSFYFNDKISRPLSYFSFALNYYFGRLNVYGYHLVNLCIHYISAVFLFLFICNTLKKSEARHHYKANACSIALLSTALWAVNPVQVLAVSYTVQRMASMAGMFYMIAMYFYLKARTDGSLKSRCLSGVACVFSAILAVGSKQNAAMLPLSLYLYDFLLLQKPETRKLKTVLVPLAIVGAAGLYYTDIASIINGYDIRPFTLGERLMTEPRIVLFYISLLFYPVTSRLMLAHDVEISKTLLTPWTTLPAMLTIMIFIALAVYKSRKAPLISFCILFFFLNHVIESSVIGLELIFEHRNYIPSMLLFVPPAILTINILDYFAYKKSLQLAIASLIIVIILSQGHTVYMRNGILRTPKTLWLTNAEKAPKLSRPHAVLGKIYFDEKNYPLAFEETILALEYKRYATLAEPVVCLGNLGNFYLMVEGNVEKALKSYHEALSHGSKAAIYDGMALAMLERGSYDQANSYIRQAIQRRPKHGPFYDSAAFILLKQGRYQEAIETAKKALDHDKTLSMPNAVIGEAFRLQEKYRPAIHYWEKFLEKNTRDLSANLALTELYSITSRKIMLNKTVGKLMLLKGDSTWRNLVARGVHAKPGRVYTPDPDKMMGIIKGALEEQAVSLPER